MNANSYGAVRISFVTKVLLRGRKYNTCGGGRGGAAGVMGTNEQHDWTIRRESRSERDLS